MSSCLQYRYFISHLVGFPYLLCFSSARILWYVQCLISSFSARLYHLSYLHQEAYLSTRCIFVAMAQNTFRKTPPPSDTGSNAPRQSEDASTEPRRWFYEDPRWVLIFGLFLLFGSIFLFFSFVSYLFTWKADQSIVDSLLETPLRAAGVETENWLGLFGALAAHLLMFKGFGIASMLFVPLLFLQGVKICFKRSLYPVRKLLLISMFFLFWLSTTFGYLVSVSGLEGSMGFMSGAVGYELAEMTKEFLGLGTILILVFMLMIFLILNLNITTLGSKSTGHTVITPVHVPPVEDIPEDQELPEEDSREEEVPDNMEFELRHVGSKPTKSPNIELEIENLPPPAPTTPLEVPTVLQPESAPEKAPPSADAKSAETVASMEPYDPTLDLSNYQYPGVNLLSDAWDNRVQEINREELEENKEKIIRTLSDFNIGITSIKATVGPTVTLYEIVPDAGIKITRIASLSDDIALRLSALGVRIIAPMPGKGTVGIEVPNKNKVVVSAKEAIQDDKFKYSKMELPIVFGKTISNEVFVTDLTKMPHLLIAGATGMGKSVGINMLLTSLLYKKHPSQLKIVMVDPKKVELSIYNKIERHFLAKLPDSEDAILVDTKKVVHTLNSLCSEMDTRYSLLRDAGCRNITEYNPKFIARKLNPNEGHRFLPYIVVVIDELADLMMTAGKEVEMPIARLAQLARAVGIHLVLATQRPEVKVITGLIKANFPARLSFRVTTKIDSKIVLDEGGADQLIGKGDMLLKFNSETIRLQCAFVDTPEVERLVDFIGDQQGYPTAYMLPEYYDENADHTEKDIDLSKRDPKFEEAARLVITHQQGSTSLIQRKLCLGYARSGRIMDQLEAAGVVGPPNGSKVREVLLHTQEQVTELMSTMV